MKEVIAAALHFVSCLSPLKGQPTICHVRLIFSLLFICVLPQHAMGPDSGRLGFICHPKINDFHKQLCFSHYSAEMSPLMGPYFFVLVTACALFVLWTTMIQYSYLHLQKSRRVKVLSEKERLCHGFWNMILFHLGSEAVVLSVILGFFCYTQKIYFPETYDCTVMIAAVITCRDQHHWVKSIFNIVFIGGMASILLLCIATVCQAVCNKEKFIKELLVLSNTVYAADDDGKHHRNTQNRIEKRVSKALKDLVNNHSDSWDEICCRLDTRVAGLGSYEDVGIHYGCDLFTMKSRFKTYPDGPSKALILYIITKQPDVTVEAFAKAVENHAGRNDVARLLREFDLKDDDGKHHRNTQNRIEKRVAQVPDDIFQLIVNDFTIRENFLKSLVFPMDIHIAYTIVHVLRTWIEDICSVMNSGELEERDKILDVLEQLPLSEALDQRITERAVMHRRHNTDIAEDRDESFQVNVSRRIVAIVDKWMEEIFSVMNSWELEERDKILDVLEQLPLSEALNQRITERAVMHRKGNTDTAQVRDEIFQVSVNRRIVAIVVKWMQELFSLMNSGELKEIAEVIDLFRQLRFSKEHDPRYTKRAVMLRRLSEVHDPRYIKRAVMLRKGNTDIAQVRDKSFHGSVNRRIVAIVTDWLEQIFRLMNSEELGEKDEILNMLEQLPLIEEVLNQGNI